MLAVQSMANVSDASDLSNVGIDDGETGINLRKQLLTFMIIY